MLLLCVGGYEEGPEFPILHLDTGILFQQRLLVVFEVLGQFLHSQSLLLQSGYLLDQVFGDHTFPLGFVELDG
jgi:hypothetical protein